LRHPASTMASCLFCFSDAPIDSSVMKPEDPRYKFYVNYQEKFEIAMDDAPCQEPAWCCLSCVCVPCTVCYMRKLVLEHVGLSLKTHYECCQGYFPNPCRPCCAPLEKSMPSCCACTEACICPGLSMSASRFVMMDHYSLGVHPVDNQIIRFNNCLQLISCICDLLAICIRPMRNLARCVNCVADVVFHITAGCMSAQVYHEINARTAIVTGVVVGGSNKYSENAPLIDGSQGSAQGNQQMTR